MKIVIRGARRAGKSALFAALQGLAYAAAYAPTEDAIKAANIAWAYKTADDLVKVEVWDVVDEGRRASPGGPCADAAFLDVYKGTHGAVFVFDVTARPTFAYVQRELARVPADIPVLVLVGPRGASRACIHRRCASPAAAVRRATRAIARASAS